MAAAATAGGGDTADAGDTSETAGSESAGGGEGEVAGIGPVECPDDPTSVTGVGEDSVTFGGIYPLSGPASAYAAIGEGAQAFFQYYAEEEGGVGGPWEGRSIEFEILDDGYNPPRTVEAARQHVQQNEVFALFNTLGTPPNSAIWDYLNEQEVPQVFVATGASKWGRDVEGHPWTIGWQPHYVAESRVYSQYLQENNPGASIAVLYQNDDYGRDYLEGFRSAIEGTDLEIVAEESYETTDPTVESQMANLAQSDADVFYNITTPTFAAQALQADAQDQQWNPVHLLNNVSASTATVSQVANVDAIDPLLSVNYFKDPAMADFEDDPAVQEYRDALQQYAGGADPTNSYHMVGWATSQSLVQAMEQMECISRSALMASLRSLDGMEVPTLLDGITLQTDGAEDGFPIESMRLQRWEGGGWEFFGEPIDTREEFGALEPVEE